MYRFHLLAALPLMALPLVRLDPIAWLVVQLAYGVAFALAVRPLPRQLARQAWLLAVCLPVVGGVLACVRLDCERRVSGLVVERAMPVEPLPPEAPTAIANAEALDAELDGPLPQKLAALAALRDCEGDAVAVLRRRLGDREPLTRLLVTLELVRRERQRNEALCEARARGDRLARARAAADYAESGLASGPTCTALWGECAEALAGDSRREAGMLRARALHALGESEPALECCEAVLARENRADAILLTCKILYETGDLRRLRTQLAQAAAHSVEARRWAEFWLTQLKIPTRA